MDNLCFVVDNSWLAIGLIRCLIHGLKKYYDKYGLKIRLSGEELRRVMDNAGITVQQLSHEAGIRQNWIKRLFRREIVPGYVVMSVYGILCKELCPLARVKIFDCYQNDALPEGQSIVV